MSRLKLTITIPPADEKEKSRILTLYSNTASTDERGTRYSNSTLDIKQTNGTYTVNKAYAITVKKLTFNKEIYKPCEILAVLSISGYVNRNDIIKALRGRDKTLPTHKIESFDKINEALARSTSSNEITKAQLDYINDKGAIQNVAKEYYIQEIIPRYINSVNGIQVEVTLKIYSMDKRLTLDKYCRAYTGRKLFTQLINKSDLDDIVSKSGVKVADVEINDRADSTQKKTTGAYELTFIKYKVEETGSDGKEKVLSPSYEFIQPYMVQYNESFYDFITRIANRCGEFVYFEDGELCMGVRQHNNSTIPSLDKIFKSVTYRDNSFGIDPIVSFTPDDWSSANITSASELKKQLYKDKKEGTGKYYDFDIPHDDYITLYEKDKFTSLLDEVKRAWAGNIFGLIGNILDTGGDLKSAIIDVAIKELMDIYEIYGQVDEFNEPRNSAIFSSSTPSDQINNDTASMYSSYLADVNKADIPIENLLHFFYDTIYELEKYISANIVEVDLGENFNGYYKLGNLVDIGGEKFMIIGVEGMDYMDNMASTNYKLVLAPIIDFKSGEGKLKCPPLLEDKGVRRSSPQLAVVADNIDPEHLGRVRVRFAWQKSNEDMSPLIRVSTPFASNNGGFYFHPQVGDEVLLDFTNGNIEHPFVAGALHNRQQPIKAYDGEQMISSPNGHCIKFTDPGDPNEFISNLWGAMGILTGMIPKLSSFLSFAKDISGGMELTDRFGLYSIELSTTNRQINITSPFGDINLNAFTGITISAPNGDVHIEGKNIDIVASNNLNITSGRNVPDVNPQMKLQDLDEETKEKYAKEEKTEKFFSSVIHKEKVKTTFLQKVKKVPGLILDLACENVPDLLGGTAANKVLGMLANMELVRTVYEAIIKPTAGNMTIKSWRFMRLEAGRGRAEIPSNGYTSSGLADVTSENYDYLIEFNKCIKCLVYAVDDWVSKSFQEYTNIVDGRKALRDFIKQEFTSTVAGQIMARVDKHVEVTTLKKVISVAKQTNKLTEDDVKSVLKKLLTEVDIELPETKKSITRVITFANNYIATAQWYVKGTYSMEEAFKKYYRGDEPTWLKAVLTRAHLKMDQLGKDGCYAIINLNENEQEFRRIKKRLLISYYVNEVIKDWKYPLFDNKIPGNDDKVKDDDAWLNFINDLHFREDGEKAGVLYGEEVSVAINQTKAKLKETFNQWKQVTTKDTWGPLKEGEILFSDKDNHTISFDDGHLKHVKNNQDELFLENAKDFLRKL